MLENILRQSISKWKSSSETTKYFIDFGGIFLNYRIHRIPNFQRCYGTLRIMVGKPDVLSYVLYLDTGFADIGDRK